MYNIENTEYFIEKQTQREYEAHVICTILFVIESVGFSLAIFVYNAGYLFYVQKFMSRYRYCKFVEFLIV